MLVHTSASDIPITGAFWNSEICGLLENVKHTLIIVD